MRVNQSRAARLSAYALMLIVIVVLQQARMPRLSLFGAYADVLPFLIGGLAVYEGPYFAGGFGFAAGLLLSVNAPGTGTVLALYYVLFGVVGGWLAGVYLRPLLTSFLLCGAVGLVLRGALAHIFYYGLAHGIEAQVTLRITLGQLLLSAPLSLLVFLAVRFVRRRFTEEDL